MTLRILALVAANLLMAALGAGLLPLLGFAATRRELLRLLPLAYAVGIAATGIVASTLTLVRIPVGWIALPLLAALSLSLGVRRVAPAEPGRRRRAGVRELPALAVLAVLALFAIPAAKLLAVKPLAESDGWTIWATRARALYDFGRPISPVFTDPLYPALQYPLLLPSLEAIDFRFMRSFDGTLVHLQLLGLAIAFVGGGWMLLREHTPRLLLAASLLAIVTAPSFYIQLHTNLADMPLAMFLALGVAALAAWLRSGEACLLRAAALFLGAGALTKNEGEMFALAAYIAAAVVARRQLLRALGGAALATFAIDLPWRIWIAVHHLPTRDYALSNLFSPSYLSDHSGRLRPAAHELWFQLWRLESWSLVVPLVFLGLAGALVLGRFRLGLFGAAWLLLGFAGLLAIYWISRNPLTNHLYNTSDRTIDTLVIGGALLVPVLLGGERQRRMLRQ